MSILTLERNYLPLDFETKYHCCRRRFESGWSIRKILGYYHVKRSSLYRWLKQYDGTKESLINKSHKPIRKHPRSIKHDIVNKILNLHKRNPDLSFIEIWVRLRRENIIISASSVLRILKRNDGYIPYKPSKKIHNKLYHTPKMVHDKWQIDVKFVPKECKAPKLEGRFYQYTILDECSRKRILYFNEEHSMYETVKALEYAKEKLGCLPYEIQTDNGPEFCDKARRKIQDLKKIDNYLERYCRLHKIKHHLIRPRTPEHNGKVERSHRIDQDKFYRKLKFYSLDDLRKQGAYWNKRYNNLPKVCLNFKTPNEVELEKLKELFENEGEIRCSRMSHII